MHIMIEANEAIWRSYQRELKSRNRSEDTIKSYYKALTELDRFLGKDVLEATKVDIQDYLSKRLTEIADTTVAIRFRSLRAFYNWAASEDEELIAKSPMAGLSEPSVTDRPPPVLRDEQIKKLLDTCSGKTFEDRRDEAIIRLFNEAGGPRLGEMSGLTVDSVDLKNDEVEVIGKRRKVRCFPLSPNTAKALERYLRQRAKYEPAQKTNKLWVGFKGGLTDSGIAQILARRGKEAGLGRIHPHQLRHTAMNAWLEDGGSESDAMHLFGWSNPEMPRRYGRAVAAHRAIKSARSRSIGNRF